MNQPDPNTRHLNNIYALFQIVLRQDISHYKSSFLLKKILHRMNILGIKKISDYVTYLSLVSAECTALSQALLIRITCFFRDEYLFLALKSQLLNRMQSNPDQPCFRVWVAGCSSGEEACSIAILLDRCLRELQLTQTFRILATDIDGPSLERARRAVYLEAEVMNLGEALIREYFTYHDSHYILNDSIREKIIYAEHNLLSNTPYGQMDLISCRNLLIYFNKKSKNQAYYIFHGALKEQGLLFLGATEAPVGHAHLFQPLNKNKKIYKSTAKTNDVQTVLSFPTNRLLENIPTLGWT